MNRSDSISTKQLHSLQTSVSRFSKSSFTVLRRSKGLALKIAPHILPIKWPRHVLRTRLHPETRPIHLSSSRANPFHGIHVCLNMSLPAPHGAWTPVKVIGLALSIRDSNNKALGRPERMLAPCTLHGVRAKIPEYRDLMPSYPKAPPFNRFRRGLLNRVENQCRPVTGWITMIHVPDVDRIFTRFWLLE